MDLTHVQEEAHQTALSRGWWGPRPHDELMRKLALLASEVGEAVHVVQEADERGAPFDRGALTEELADCVIRCADIAGRLGLDLDGAVEAKLKRIGGRVNWPGAPLHERGWQVGKEE